jgi:hypothetical protein
MAGISGRETYGRKKGKEWVLTNFTEKKRMGADMWAPHPPHHQLSSTSTLAAMLALTARPHTAVKMFLDTNYCNL